MQVPRPGVVPGVAVVKLLQLDAAAGEIRRIEQYLGGAAEPVALRTVGDRETHPPAFIADEGDHLGPDAVEPGGRAPCIRAARRPVAVREEDLAAAGVAATTSGVRVVVVPGHTGRDRRV